MNIHPSLITKLQRLHAIFLEQWRQVPLYCLPKLVTGKTTQNNVHITPTKTSSLIDLAIQSDKTDDGDSGSDESGGGTMKGLRVEKDAYKAGIW